MDENNQIEIMQPDTFTDLTQQIVDAGDDQGKVVKLLTQIREGYSNLFATHANVLNERDQLQEKNQKLKQDNYDLFMDRGAFLQQQAQMSIQGGANTVPPKSDARQRAETITIDDLFKEDKK